MIKNGIIAGFAATVVLSAIMIMKSMMGVMPAFNAIKDWSTLLSGFGLPASMAVAWIAHFIVGTFVWGGLYAILRPQLPGSTLVSGIVFGILAWLGMMLFFMPLVGHGLFALGIGPMVTMATLMLHVIFGAVMGFVYGKLGQETSVAQNA